MGQGYLSVTPDQLVSLGSYVAREWGDYGYRFESIHSPNRLVTVGHVVCSDGGRFWVAVDRYGNSRYGDHDSLDARTLGDAIDQLTALATTA
jgi:hypothetical protein